MFFVMNKGKIISGIVALTTVLVLFLIANAFRSNEIKTIGTSAKVEKVLPVYCVDTQEEKVSLTINCAWNADDVDLILSTLAKNNVKVTFFMVGDWVEKYPDAVKKIYDAGQEIANHSDTHPHVNNLDYDTNVIQIVNCSNKINAIIGKGTSLYRGPYGEYNDTVLKAAKDTNHIAIQWSIDTLDYEGLTGDQMWGRIEPKLTNGSIILMHNGTENTALSLDSIIKNIKDKGYDIVPVSELIYKDNYIIDVNGVQHKN